MSSGALGITFVTGALLGALASAWNYVAAILNRNRVLSRTAAAAHVGFCMAAGVYLWVLIDRAQDREEVRKGRC